MHHALDSRRVCLRCCSLRPAQFPHLLLPVFGFAVIGLVVLAMVGQVAWTTRKQDEIIAGRLFTANAATAISPPISPSPSWVRSNSPPPSPPVSPPPVQPSGARVAPAVALAAVPAVAPSPHHLRAGSSNTMRLRELQALQAEGLITEDEGKLKRQQILAAL